MKLQINHPMKKQPSLPLFGAMPRWKLLLAASSSIYALATGDLSASSAIWTQTGASTATSVALLDSNMNWGIAANWSGNAVPGVDDTIQFNNVTADTSAFTSLSGRVVGLLNTQFLGTGASSLTLTQTSNFQNQVMIRQDANGASTLSFSIGQVTLTGANTLFRYDGLGRSDVGSVRSLTLGAGNTSVTNGGTLLLVFGPGSNSKSVAGALSIAQGSTFANSGTTTIQALGGGNAQGSGYVNALIGATTNSGAIVIKKSGDGTYNTSAGGGIEFATLNNSISTSSFNFSANYKVQLAATGSAIADRAANLVVGGALQNSGTMTISRTPLTTASDATSRTVTAQYGSFTNNATGLYLLDHNNSATPLTTTTSTLSTTVLGAMSNAGWMSLKGTATSGPGAIVTNLITQGGFSNIDGGIISVTGTASLINTGSFSNSNQLASKTIQATVRVWNTTGLTLQTTTATAADFNWATGIDIDPTTLTSGAAGTFTAANFTLGVLEMNTGSGSNRYTLGGGGDLLIENGFTLAGTLNLGDWTSVTTTGGAAQTLFFDDYSLRDSINSHIASGDIFATLNSGYSLSTFSNSTEDAFYIGVTAVPEPSAAQILLFSSFAAAGWINFRRRLAAR